MDDFELRRHREDFYQHLSSINSLELSFQNQGSWCDLKYQKDLFYVILIFIFVTYHVGVVHP